MHAIQRKMISLLLYSDLLCTRFTLGLSEILWTVRDSVGDHLMVPFGYVLQTDLSRYEDDRHKRKHVGLNLGCYGSDSVIYSLLRKASQSIRSMFRRV